MFLLLQSDAGWEECYNYIFPDGESTKPNIKLLAMAKQWGEKKEDDDDEEDDDNEEIEEESDEEEEEQMVRVVRGSNETSEQNGH